MMFCCSILKKAKLTCFHQKITVKNAAYKNVAEIKFDESKSKFFTIAEMKNKRDLKFL